MLSYHDWKIKFVPNDLWVGVYWKTSPPAGLNRSGKLELYICVIPCFPLYISLWRDVPPPGRVGHDGNLGQGRCAYCGSLRYPCYCKS